MLNKRCKTDSQHFCIISWNVWCMLLAPRALSNPCRCSQYLCSINQQQKFCEFDGLVICGLQEIWAINTGCIPSVVLSSFASLFEYIEFMPHLGYYLSVFFQLFSFIIGIIPIFKILTFKYCPKQFVANKLADIGLKYNYFDNKIPLLKTGDNGLLLLSNIKPSLTGSYAYVHALFDDSMANKGFIYMYFESYHCLVVNTHLQARGNGKERLEQLQELNDFLVTFANKYKIENKELKIIVFGDFNIDMSNHYKIVKYEKQKNLLKVNEVDFEEKCKHLNDQIEKAKYRKHKLKYIDIPSVLGDKFKKINCCEPTFMNEMYGNIDHIMTNFDIKNHNEQVLGKEPKLSDHYLIINQFDSDLP
eukprot:390823_1